ncbi:hypothetical protein [Escherichia albertii]|nr:hypothetical protein [Escherichia albertii]
MNTTFTDEYLYQPPLEWPEDEEIEAEDSDYYDSDTIWVDE